VPYHDSALHRIRARSYPAAAGSASQFNTEDGIVLTNEDDPSLSVVLPDGSSLGDILSLRLLNGTERATQTTRSYVFSAVILDYPVEDDCRKHVRASTLSDAYIQRSIMLWRVRTPLHSLLPLLPAHDPTMLCVSLTSLIRRVKLSADVHFTTDHQSAWY